MPLDEALKVVSEQAEDEGLWFVPETIPRIICNGHCDVYMLLSKENRQLNVP